MMFPMNIQKCMFLFLIVQALSSIQEACLLGKNNLLLRNLKSNSLNSLSTLNSWKDSTFVLKDGLHAADSKKKTFDPLAGINYIAATTVQSSLIYGTLNLVQNGILKNLKSKGAIELNASRALVIFVFAFLALRSRVFSPLDNSRPSALKDDPVFKNRKSPVWMPPRLVFPIVWTSITLLRIVSSYLVYEQTGTLLCAPIYAIVAHLSIGDTWNTINNVENRLGTAALVVLFVLASCLYAVRLFYEALPLAGYILAPSAVWLGIATTLVHRIWRLNKETFGEPSYFPSKEEGPPSSWKFLRTSTTRTAK